MRLVCLSLTSEDNTLKHSHKIPLVFALVVAACPAFAATNTLHDKTAKGSPTTADETYLWDVTDNTLKKATLGTLPVSTPQQASLDDKANTSCFVDASAFNACFGLDWATGGTFDQAGNYTLTGSWDFTGATVTGVSDGSMVYPGAGISVSTGSAWGVSLALDTDLSSVSASDDSVPSAKATKAALDALPNIVFGTGLTVAEDTPSVGTDTVSITANIYQAYDADLTIYAGITPSANIQSLLGAANYAAMRTLLDLEVGTDFNAYDADLEDLSDGSLTASKVAGSAATTASKSTTYTIGTDSVNESYGGTVYVTSATTVTAPAVVSGMNFSVVTIGDVAVSLDVNAADKMILDGVTLADGDKATNSSKAGDTITCQYYSADGWYCWSGTVLGGHWTDGN